MLQEVKEREVTQVNTLTAQISALQVALGTKYIFIL
jgi:hypothetical protein